MAPGVDHKVQLVELISFDRIWCLTACLLESVQKGIRQKVVLNIVDDVLLEVRVIEQVKCPRRES